MSYLACHSFESEVVCTNYIPLLENEDKVIFKKKNDQNKVKCNNIIETTFIFLKYCWCLISEVHIKGNSTCNKQDISSYSTGHFRTKLIN